MMDRGSPGSKEGWGVDHLDGSQGGGLEADIDGLEGKSAERFAAHTNGRHAQASGGLTVVEIGSPQKRIPLQPARVVMPKVEDGSTGGGDDLTDFAVRHGNQVLALRAIVLGRPSWAQETPLTFSPREAESAAARSGGTAAFDVCP